MQRLKWSTVLVLAVMTAGLCGATARAAAQAVPGSSRILLVYAPAPDSPTSAEFIERFRTTMRTEMAPSVEFYEEFLDLDRFPGPDRWPILARYFDDKYQGFRIDLIVCVGSVALRFATDQLREVFPNVPVVFGMTYAHRVNLADLPANVTGRLITVSLGPTLTMARRLQPDANQVVVIAGSSAIDSIAMAGALSSLEPLRDSLRLVLRYGWPFDSLLSEIRQLPRESIVFIAHFRRDGGGQLFVPLDAITTIAKESRAPVYGYVDKMLGTGVLGGAMLRHDDEAAHTARLAIRVLRRAPGQPVPPVESAGTSFFADWRALRRWRLDERRLPPGTEVLFRAPTVWERYRTIIVVALGVMVAQAVLIGLLLVERRRRRRAQAALADQVDYERTMAELTTDAVRYAPDDAPRALEDALSRIGRYAQADVAILVRRADPLSRPGTRLYWSRTTGVRTDGASTNGAMTSGAMTNGNGSGHASSAVAIPHGARLDLPLMVGGKAVGILELFRADTYGGWSPQMVARLGAAGELLAGAIARSNAAVVAEETSRQLAHLGRVATVGELAATISHEVRQPLAAIRSNAELGAQLLDGPKPDIDEAKQVLAEIVADDLRAADVIEHIRLLLRKQEPGTSLVDLNAVVRQAVLLLERDARKRGVRLSIALEAGLPAVLANDAELQQVVLNLVLNAIDALAGHAGRREVVMGTSARDSSVELFVRDTGPGFSSAVEAQLFDSFFSTKPHGLGVGLPIVRSIVERFRGQVLAENGPEGGAVFRVILPATSSAA